MAGSRGFKVRRVRALLKLNKHIKYVFWKVKIFTISIRQYVITVDSGSMISIEIVHRTQTVANSPLAICHRD